MDYRTIIKSLSSGKYEILITGKLNAGDIIMWGHDPKEEDGLEKWQVISSERR